MPELKHIEFPEQNKVYTTPNGMTKEQCGNLNTYAGLDDDGYPMIISKWKISEQDKQKIIDGQDVDFWLIVLNTGMPPVCITTENPFEVIDKAFVKITVSKEEKSEDIATQFDSAMFTLCEFLEEKYKDCETFLRDEYNDELCEKYSFEYKGKRLSFNQHIVSKEEFIEVEFYIMVKTKKKYTND